MEKFDLHAQLYEAKRRFNRACDQIFHLRCKLGDLNQRYLDARNHGNQVFRRSLSLRIIIAEGVMKAFTRYACLKKNEVLDIRFKLYGENPDEGELLYGDSEEDYITDEEWRHETEQGSTKDWRD